MRIPCGRGWWCFVLAFICLLVCLFTIRGAFAHVSMHVDGTQVVTEASLHSKLAHLLELGSKK